MVKVGEIAREPPTQGGSDNNKKAGLDGTSTRGWWGLTGRFLNFQTNTFV